VSNHRVKNGCPGKLKFGGHARGGTDYGMVHPGSDREASLKGNAVVRCEIGHEGDGLWAGGLKYQDSWCI
jgi:hypothetical protein